MRPKVGQTATYNCNMLNSLSHCRTEQRLQFIVSSARQVN